MASLSPFSTCTCSCPGGGVLLWTPHSPGSLGPSFLRSPLLQLCIPQHSQFGAPCPPSLVNFTWDSDCTCLLVHSSPHAVSCGVCRGSRPEPLPTVTRAIPPAQTQEPPHRTRLRTRDTPPLIPSAAFSDLPHPPQTSLKEKRRLSEAFLKCLVLDHPIFPPQ